MATSCEELTHWKRPWCWEGLGAGGQGDDRGWDGWMASLTRCTWVWVNSGSWWWTERPGVMWFMGSQEVGHHWATELNWIYPHYKVKKFIKKTLFPTDAYLPQQGRNHLREKQNQQEEKDNEHQFNIVLKTFLKNFKGMK